MSGIDTWPISLSYQVDWPFQRGRMTAKKRANKNKRAKGDYSIES